MYDVQIKYGLNDIILVPLQVVRQTSWLGTGHQFITRYAHIEIHEFEFTGTRRQSSLGDITPLRTGRIVELKIVTS